MTFSLLTVHTTNPDGTVNGTWLQDHIGTPESARERAAQTEQANSHRITVAVVEALRHPAPALEYWTDRRTV